MALWICTGLFMVESGYLDGPTAHASVAYEFTKVKRLYDRMGIGNLTEFEFFWADMILTKRVPLGFCTSI